MKKQPAGFAVRLDSRPDKTERCCPIDPRTFVFPTDPPLPGEITHVHPKAKCPFNHGAGAPGGPKLQHSAATSGGTSNRDWWPNQLKPRAASPSIPARPTHSGRTLTTRRSSRASITTGLKQDLAALMTDSQDWWPRRLRPLRSVFSSAWHGTAPARNRIGDGPRRRRNADSSVSLRSTSWPDNVQPGQGAPPALWPIKQKYGSEDFLGRPDDSHGANVALETMGFQRRFGFCRRPRGTSGSPTRMFIGAARRNGLGGDNSLRPGLAGRPPDTASSTRTTTARSRIRATLQKSPRRGPDGPDLRSIPEGPDGKTPTRSRRPRDIR